jgi:2-oxoglutarate ferredoxin oxidoreductase subunit alpha
VEHTLTWIQTKFGPKTKYKEKPEIASANQAALLAGFNYAETVELFASHYRVRKADLPPGKYRKISGNEATVFGLIAAAQKAGLEIVYGSYPITPASDVLHGLSRQKHFGVTTFQAEDEIAAMASIVGAAYAGALGVTATSGPGICLKSEAMGLAVMTELPMVVIDVQRGGPSTGLPTKTEQSDLLLNLYGRSGDSPLPIVAAKSPADCFNMAYEASRLALKYMTPVVLLTDGYIANGSEPWLIPDPDALPPIDLNRVTKAAGEFLPYERNPETLARPWAKPGMPGLEHRIGGLEKAQQTGKISYDPDNHDAMTRERAAKVAGIAKDIPAQVVEGDPSADLLVVSWGGTYGAVSTAVYDCNQAGIKVAHVHIQYLNPFPANLGQILASYKRVVVPELNMGQLRLVLGGTFGVSAQGINLVRGKPFRVSYLVDKFERIVKAIS